MEGEPGGWMIRKLKDQALAWTATQFLRSRIEDYGRILALNLDSSSREVRGEFLLRGETEPVYAVLSGYQVTENDGTLSLSFASLETSREWLNQLLRDLLPGNTIRLPSTASRYAGIIRLLLE
jgi:S-adenosylmethionine synthetase